MTPLPKDPIGPSPLVQTVRLLIRCIRERTVLPDLSQFELDRTVEGRKLRLRKQLGSNVPGTGGGNVPRWG